MLSNIVRGHPDLLSLSELFVLIGDRAFPDGPVSGEQFWDIIGRPNGAQRMLQRSGVTFPELLYQARPGGRFTAETGIPPIMLTPLPHLAGHQEAELLYDEIGAWAVGLDERPAADQYRRLFGWLCGRLGRRVWFERSGASLPQVRVLAHRFPEAGILHVYRDGRECAMSMSRHGGFKLMAFRNRPELAPAGLQRDGLVDPDVLARAVVAPEVAGRVWSDMVVAGVADLADLPADRVLSLGYEALTTAPRDELRRLAAFIGVEPDAAWLEGAAAIVRIRPPTWTTLPDTERRRLQDACAPGMDLLYRSWR